MTPPLAARSHLVVAGSAWASRIVLALLQVASVRLLTIGLGQPSYAVYALLAGVAAWFTLADLGLPAALQNFISESRARQHDYAPAVARCAALAVAGGAVLAGLAWVVAPWVAGPLMANLTGVPADARLRSLRLLAVACIALASGSLVYKVWYGEHRGWLAHLCQLAAGLLSYGATALVLRGDPAHRLEWSVAAWFGFNALLPVACLAWRSRGLSGPGRAGLPRGLARQALGFWGYAWLAALVLQLDYVLIAFLLGPDDLVAYSLYARIFGLGLLVYSSVLGALWPVLAERAVQGRGAEMLASATRHVAAGLAFMLGFTAVVARFDGAIFGLLSPTLHVATSPGFVLAMGGYFLVRVWTDTFAMLLQSMGYLRPFYLLVPVQALASIAGQVACVRLWGLVGIPLGMGLSFLLTVAWAMPLLARRRSAGLRAPG